MKILFWCPHVNLGGGIRLLSQLIPALVRRSEVEMVRLAVPRGIDWETYGFHTLAKLETFELENPGSEDQEERGALVRAASAGCDLMYVFWPQSQPFYAPLIPMVCTYQDTTLLDFPEIIGYPARDAEYALANQWVSGATRVVVSSQATKANLIRLFGSELASATVIPHAILPDSNRSETKLAPAISERIPERYFVCATNITPHKNHYPLLVAWSRFERRKEFPLVLFGLGTDLLTSDVYLGHAFLDRVKGFIARSQLVIGEDFLTLGYVDDADVLPLIQGATALIMPSLAEGGGSYPVEEALSVGTPVLCSDIPVMREHLSSRSAKIGWFDPESADSILRALNDLLDDYSEYRNTTLRGMSDRRYTWDEVAAQYVKVFQSAIERSRNERE
jgi:glycosyltransferase involved in cell wall biosynthesis